MIPEKALVKNMKTAYAAGGLRVWRAEYQHVDSLLFWSAGWLSITDTALLPRKALALLVEYLGKIPLLDEAFWLCKGRDADRIKPQDVALLPLLEALPSHNVGIRDTNVLIDGCRLIAPTVGELIALDGDELTMCPVALERGLYNPNTETVLWRESEDVQRLLLYRTYIRRSPEFVQYIGSYNFWEEGDVHA